MKVQSYNFTSVRPKAVIDNFVFSNVDKIFAVFPTIVPIFVRNRYGSGPVVKSAVMTIDDPLGLSQLEDKYRLAMELFDVRILLEPEVAAVACTNATEEDKKHIKELCDEVEQLYTDGKNHIQKDMEFHEAIAKCSGNRVFEILIPVIFTAITTFANLTNRKLMKETIETHRKITEAIISGDSMGAKCAMIMHLTYNRQMLLDLSKKK